MKKLRTTIGSLVIAAISGGIAGGVHARDFTVATWGGGYTDAQRAVYATDKDLIAVAYNPSKTCERVDGGYRLQLEGKTLDTLAMIELLERWVDRYPIVSLEDPLAEDDDQGFAEITRRLGHAIQIIGDDYLTTSAARVAEAAGLQGCNSVLLKANQCGTLTELIAASHAGRTAGWNTIQSGRSGESEDITLSHLAVGLKSDQIKVGSMTRSERTAKWNGV